MFQLARQVRLYADVDVAQVCWRLGLRESNGRSLPIGSVRYGVMCAEDGVVLDDGVTGRLGEDRYMMTTTSERRRPRLRTGSMSGCRPFKSGVGCDQDHADDRRLCQSINVAGPQARERLIEAA